MQMVNMQPSILWREALVGIGVSMLIIISSLVESTKAQTLKLEVRKKNHEKFYDFMNFGIRHE